MRRSVKRLRVHVIAALFGSALATDSVIHDARLSGAQAPVFTGGVELRTLDVVVLDRARRPIGGLGREDFEIREGGVVQRIATFAEVTIPGPEANGAPWTREVGPDVASNDIAGRRLVVILLDDGGTGVTYGEPAWVRKVAHAVIDQLGPVDLAAVTHSYLGWRETFTADRQRLRNAVESFAPQAWGKNAEDQLPLACRSRVGGCLLSALRNTADALRSAPTGRKILIVVTPGILLATQRHLTPGSLVGNEGVREILQNLQETNTTVFAFDPRGLRVAVDSAGISDEVELAGVTGGRTIRDTNFPERAVPAVMAESSHYYLLGYEPSSFRPDGRFRRVEVRVARTDATVRTRSGYFAAPLATPRHPLSTLERALAGGTPAPGIPLRVGTATIAGGPAWSDVAVLVSVDPAPIWQAVLGDSADLHLRISAFDVNWREAGRAEQTLRVVRGRSLQTTGRLRLKPGWHELRVAVASSNLSGSAFMTLNVPNVSRSPLVLSGVVVDRPPPGERPPVQTLGGSMPEHPTTARMFDSGESVSAFVRVFQGGSVSSHKGVDVRATVATAAGTTAFEERMTLEPRAFSPAGFADYRISLPLDRLAPGDCLLTVEFTMGSSSETRSLRFTVR